MNSQSFGEKLLINATGNYWLFIQEGRSGGPIAKIQHKKNVKVSIKLHMNIKVF